MRVRAREGSRWVSDDRMRKRCFRFFADSKLRLFWRDGNLDRSIRSEMVAIRRMVLGVPVPDASPYLAQEVEASLLGQVSQVADQVCDGMLVASSAVLLENFDRIGGPGDVVRVVDHAITILVGFAPEARRRRNF